MTELALTNYSWGLKLATKQPSETLKELETKLSDILGTCERTWQHQVGPYGYDPVHTGYEIICNDRDKLIRALDLAKKALQLRVLYSVQARVGENISVEKKAHQMALLLGDVPADLLVYAVKTNAKQQKFWATYAELWELIVFKLEARQNLLKSIEKKLNSL
jgi:hypothetical protein